MALITEEQIKQLSQNGTKSPICLAKDARLTPSARSFLLQHRVEVLTDTPTQAETPARYRTLFGASLQEKPEHMTHLKGNVLVFKDHPRIAFRGYIDALEGEICLCQVVADRAGAGKLVEDLGVLLDFVRRFIRFDVLDEAVGTWTLCGYTPEDLREKSHHPEQYFGQGHFMVSYQDGEVILSLNRLRTLVRQTELSAYRAFRDEYGAVSRADIILALNRLSSFLWICMIQEKRKQVIACTAQKA